MENKDYIVAVDLGDSNIVVGVGSAAEGGRINIDHILSRPSEGVSVGQIVNIDDAIKSIKNILQELKETTGLDAKEVYAGISGEFIYCTSHTDHVFVPDHKNGVTQQVVEALFERMSNVMVSEGRNIMERIPQRYVINDTTEVDNPVGVFGSPLSSTFNFISSDSVPLTRLDMAFRRLNITPRRTFSNAVVVGDAVLSLDEKEEGVVVVDLGGELTDIAIYYHNIIRYISTIPLGAKAFNNDIRTLTIPERHIEPLKLKYGYALAKKAPQDVSVIIKGRSRHDQREIAVYNLAAVIEARARDIAELVSKEIADSGFADKIPYGIVLTGGSAQLRGLAELFYEVTGCDVRVAEAEDVISYQTRTKITSSADSTVVGLLLHGLKYGPCEVIVGEPTVVPPPAPVPFGTNDAKPNHDSTTPSVEPQHAQHPQHPQQHMPTEPKVVPHPVQPQPVAQPVRPVAQPTKVASPNHETTTPAILEPAQPSAPRTLYTPPRPTPAPQVQVPKPEPIAQPTAAKVAPQPIAPAQPAQPHTAQPHTAQSAQPVQSAQPAQPQPIQPQPKSNPVAHVEDDLQSNEPIEVEESQPKRRMFKIFNSFANVVKSVNTVLDGSEDEEV